MSGRGKHKEPPPEKGLKSENDPSSDNEEEIEEVRQQKKRNAVYSKRSYYKKRSEHEKLEATAAALYDNNARLKAENALLEDLLLRARSEVLLILSAVPPERFAQPYFGTLLPGDDFDAMLPRGAAAGFPSPSLPTAMVARRQELHQPYIGLPLHAVAAASTGVNQGLSLAVALGIPQPPSREAATLAEIILLRQQRDMMLSPPAFSANDELALQLLRAQQRSNSGYYSRFPTVPPPR